ncbi:MAG: 50S ribosomal protein L35 [Endomicrobium sp.]|jgi:large subunit ribosomal protein L35|nr:50S ribosomal protein L35 [Endomicrobium sp.]
MYKLKSHSGTKKRFKITSKGKVKFKKPGQRHLLIGDSSNQNRLSRKLVIISKQDIKIIKKNLPYAF